MILIFVNQPGAQGVCKTHYIISEDAKADRILLTKTKDLSHCQERILKDIGLAYTEKCVECEAVSAVSPWFIRSVIVHFSFER